MRIKGVLDLPFCHGKYDIELVEGRPNVLIGENGAGKSTIAKNAARQSSLFAVAFQHRLTTATKMSTQRFMDLVMSSEYAMKSRANELADILKINQTLSTAVNLLSGGESQRLKLWSCLLQRRSGYLLDEPFQYLDESSRENLVELIEKIAKDSFILVIDHETERFQAAKVFYLKNHDGEISLA